MATTIELPSQAGQAVDKPSRPASTVIQEHVAILRELNAPASLIAIAEKVAAGTKPKSKS